MMTHAIQIIVVALMGCCCSFALAGNQTFFDFGRDCTYWDSISGNDYWYLVEVQEVESSQDIGAERVGNRVRYPAECFRVPLSQVNDPIQRTLGAKLALKDWLLLAYRNQNEWQSTANQEVLRKFRDLTNMSFSSFPELQGWWIANNDFLAWSDSQILLLVDEKSKEQGVPIAPLNPTQSIAANRYWFYEGLGWVRDFKDDSGTRQAEVWNGEREIKIEIGTEKLSDNVAKQKGYLDAVELIVDEILTIPELGMSSEAKSLVRLAYMTTEGFQGKAAWITWWQANKNELVLSPDGKHLIKK